MEVRFEGATSPQGTVREDAGGTFPRHADARAWVAYLRQSRVGHRGEQEPRLRREQPRLVAIRCSWALSQISSGQQARTFSWLEVRRKQRQRTGHGGLVVGVR